MQNLRTRAGLALASLFLSCTELSDIPANSCGNGVLDPGEECDIRKGNTCVQCRWACGTTPDAPKCPQGFACGTDNICRKPSGTYQEVWSDARAFSYALTKGNFDARDGDELVVLGDQCFVYAYDKKRTLQRSTAISSSTPVGSRHAAATLRLNEDERDDLIIATSSGDLDVLMGEESGSLRPYSHARNLSFGEARPLSANTSASRFRPELLVLAENKLYARSLSSFELEPRFELATTINQVASQIAIGNIDATRCDELGLGETATNRALIVNLCLPEDLVPDAESTTLSYVKLPEGMTFRSGLLFAEMDGNAHLDLLATVAVKSGAGDAGAGDARDAGAGDTGDAGDVWQDAVVVAYGVGDGTFSSKPNPPATQKGDGLFSSEIFVTNDGGGHILEAGFLNEDAFSDFILENGSVMLSGTEESFAAMGASPCANFDKWGCIRLRQALFENWAFARIGDFDANGIPDVLAGVAELRRLEFLRGAGNGAFNHYAISAPGIIASSLPPAIGDFDGDLVSDFAFVYYADESQDVASLGLLFGSAHGVPQQISDLGALGQSPFLAAGHSDIASNDGLNDLLALWRKDSTLQFAIFDGRSDRQPYAPFSLHALGADGKPVRARAAAVFAGNFSGKQRSELGIGISDDMERSFLQRLSKLETASTESTLVSIPPYTFSWAGINLDLEADGSEELVLLGQPERDEISVLKPQGGAWSTAGSPIKVSETHNLRVFPERADFDADGVPDLLMRSVGPDDGLLLFRSAGRGHVALTAAQALSIPGRSLLTMRALEVDGDPESEVVLAIADRIHATPYQLEFYDVSLDPFALRLKFTQQLPKADFQYLTDEDADPAEAPDGEFSDGSLEVLFGITIGDFDGNGLDDIAVGGRDVTIYFAKAANDN